MGFLFGEKFGWIHWITVYCLPPWLWGIHASCPVLWSPRPRDRVEKTALCGTVSLSSQAARQMCWYARSVRMWDDLEVKRVPGWDEGGVGAEWALGWSVRKLLMLFYRSLFFGTSSLEWGLPMHMSTAHGNLQQAAAARATYTDTQTAVAIRWRLRITAKWPPIVSNLSKCSGHGSRKIGKLSQGTRKVSRTQEGHEWWMPETRGCLMVRLVALTLEKAKNLKNKLAKTKTAKLG